MSAQRKPKPTLSPEQAVEHILERLGHPEAFFEKQWTDSIIAWATGMGYWEARLWNKHMYDMRGVHKALGAKGYRRADQKHTVMWEAHGKRLGCAYARGRTIEERRAAAEAAIIRLDQ